MVSGILAGHPMTFAYLTFLVLGIAAYFLTAKLGER